MEELYREELLELVRHPINKGKILNPTVSAHKTNLLCGDEVTVHLLIVDDKIKEVKHEGQACAVSIISSSLLSEHVQNMSVVKAKKITKTEVLDLIGVNLTTSRVKCAVLFFDALQESLSQYNSHHED
jgi:nitrogen fixation NifU-like protein